MKLVLISSQKYFYNLFPPNYNNSKPQASYTICAYIYTYTYILYMHQENICRIIIIIIMVSSIYIIFKFSHLLS
jgi:hypothetical protein